MRILVQTILIIVTLIGSASNVFALSSQPKPQRIVTLAPSLAELAAEILGENISRIVGVTEYTDFPSRLKDRPVVGSYSRFSLEKVLALRPDLVLATRDGNPKLQVDRLSSLGISVHLVDTRNFDDVVSAMKSIGLALGEVETGLRVATRFQNGLTEIEKRKIRRTKEHAALRVALQIGVEPIVMAGAETFLDEAIERIGAVNPFHTHGTGYLRPSVESVLQAKPDLIVVLVLTDDLKPFEREVAAWKKHKINAKLLRADGLLRPSSRLLDGVVALEKIAWEGR